MNMNLIFSYLQWGVFFIHLLVFNLGWIVGLRSALKNKGYFTKGTALGALLLTLETSYFLFTDTNKIWMVLVTPFICFILGGAGLLQLLFSIPVLGSFLSYITQLFVSIVTIGVKVKQNTFQDDFNKVFKDLKDEK